MIISIITAMDTQRGIGRNNQLPWKLSADLKRFRDLTMGHHIIVGRKTFESIGKPLPGRDMIVVTNNHKLNVTGCSVCHSLEDAIKLAHSRGETEVFVCGGAEIYQQSIALADRLYLTLVDTEVCHADTFFPQLYSKDWDEVERISHIADNKNEYTQIYITLYRIK
jgi:dihydrofolate reductase